MSELYDNNELDNTFRRGIEGRSMEPPPMVWNNIKHVALEQQLVNTTTTSLWLKGVAGALAAAVIGLSVVVWKQSNDISELQNRKPIAQVDTVYVVKSIANSDIANSQEALRANSEVVNSQEAARANGDIVNSPSPRSVFSQNSSTKLPVKTQATDIETEATNISSRFRDNKNNDKAIVGNNSQKLKNSPKNIAQSTENEVVGGEIVDENETVISTNENFEIAIKNNDLTKNRSNKGVLLKNNNTFANRNKGPKTAEKQINNAVKSNNYTNNSTFVAENNGTNPLPTTEYVEPSRQQNERVIPNIEPLVSLPVVSEGIPMAAVEMSNIPQPTATAPVSRKPKSQMSWDWLNNFSISAYTMPEANHVSIIRTEANAFAFANQEVNNGRNDGFKIGYKLTKKWSIEAGLSRSLVEFEQDDDMMRNPGQLPARKPQQIKVENHNGKDKFLLRTATGTVEIPTENWGRLPRPDETIQLRTESSQDLQMLRIPVSIRYDFLQKRWQKYSLSAYALAGPTLMIPFKQSAKVEIELPNGVLLKENLTQFDNISNSLALHASIGAELGYGYHARFFVEPTANQGFTSIVKNMPIRTLAGSLGLKFGLKWQFGK